MTRAAAEARDRCVVGDAAMTSSPITDLQNVTIAKLTSKDRSAIKISRLRIQDPLTTNIDDTRPRIEVLLN